MLGLQLFSMSIIFYAVFVCAVVGVSVVVYISSRSPSRNKTLLDDLILDEQQKNIDGYTSNADKSKFLGAIGVCLTDLRPSGTVIVEGEPLDVVTEGSFVKQGNIVKIINVDGSRILVRQI
ncbi:MAG: hypothetical protein IK062_04860 [Selenomonadaceae bacterium]|nr:hypothetical protein [Selenomonadaceae bacterium]